jgi:hypothetical protein
LTTEDSIRNKHRVRHKTEKSRPYANVLDQGSRSRSRIKIGRRKGRSKTFNDLASIDGHSRHGGEIGGNNLNFRRTRK